MRVTRLEIRNFRSIRHLALDLGKTTVFVGPNNAGKTAILDALRIALTRRWGQRGTGFTEYDVHLANDTDDPKTERATRRRRRVLAPVTVLGTAAQGSGDSGRSGIPRATRSRLAESAPAES